MGRRKMIWGVEVITGAGPSGTIVEALEIEILDGAGNVLWSGVPDDAPTFNIPTRIFASKTGKKISNADKMCDF